MQRQCPGGDGEPAGQRVARQQRQRTQAIDEYQGSCHGATTIQANVSAQVAATTVGTSGDSRLYRYQASAAERWPGNADHGVQHVLGVVAVEVLTVTWASRQSVGEMTMAGRLAQRPEHAQAVAEVVQAERHQGRDRRGADQPGPGPVVDERDGEAGRDEAGVDASSRTSRRRAARRRLVPRAGCIAGTATMAAIAKGQQQSRWPPMTSSTMSSGLAVHRRTARTGFSAVRSRMQPVAGTRRPP